MKINTNVDKVSGHGIIFKHARFVIKLPYCVCIPPSVGREIYYELVENIISNNLYCEILIVGDFNLSDFDRSKEHYLG